MTAEINRRHLLTAVPAAGFAALESEAAAFIAHFNEGKPFIWMSCPEALPEDGSYCWRAGATLSATFDAGAVWGDMSMEVAAHV